MSVFLTLGVVGCGNSASPSAGFAPRSTSQAVKPLVKAWWHGHFRGTTTIGDEIYHAEALLTVDGAVRLYVGGPTSAGEILLGAPLSGEVLNPEQSTLFVGNLEVNENQAFGAGLIFGQLCAASGSGRFCNEPALAEISIAAMSSDYLAGEIRIATSEGQETWLLSIGKHSAYYELSANQDSPGGAYKEELAQFAQLGDVIVTIDGAGRLFFEGADSACTGNGTLAPHLEGQSYVFDVELIIESCDARYSLLNGEFEGLATETQNGYWDYDDWLLMFLSTPAGSVSQAAITMFGRHL